MTDLFAFLKTEWPEEVDAVLSGKPASGGRTPEEVERLLAASWLLGAALLALGLSFLTGYFFTFSSEYCAQIRGAFC